MKHLVPDLVIIESRRLVVNKDLVRGSFSFLAAMVTLGMAQEWATWAAEERRYWKLLPAALLAMIATFEAHQVWKRAEQVIGL